MKKNVLVLGLFLCLALTQVATPLSMIVKRELTLRNGEQFRFHTAPIDPYDAFRGRYVAVGVEQDNAPVPAGLKLENGQKVYAHIEKDNQGFAVISKVTLEKPKNGTYLTTKVRYVYKGEMFLDMPFDRYYMEEKAAPAAEAIYQKHHGEEKQDSYVIVRIRSGFAVLEELYIGGQPVSEIIKRSKL